MSARRLTALLFDQAQKTPNRTYILHRGSSVTYGEFAAAVRSLGEEIRSYGRDAVPTTLAVSTDDPVRLMSVVWACAYAGKSLAFCPRCEDFEPVREAMSQVGADVLFSDNDAHAGRPQVASLSQLIVKRDTPAPVADFSEIDSVEATRSAFLFQTSGTSGEPKWVRCEYWKCAAVVESMWVQGMLRHAVDQTVFLTAPLFHSYGLSSLFEYTRAGGTIVLPAGDSPIGPVGELRQPELARKITAIEGVPNFHLQLSQLVNRLSLESLRHIGFGGGGLDSMAAERLRAKNPQLSFSVRYGLTETPSVVTHNVFRPPYNQDWRSSGRVVPIYRVEIVGPGGQPMAAGEEGEIVVHGQCVSGYLGAESSNTLRTGDLGYLSQGGELFVVGRRSAFLKYRGYRLSPEQIESAIRTFDGITDCRVLVKDAQLIAEVVHSSTDSFKADLVKHLAFKLPIYAVPERVVTVELIPRTESGKIKRL